MEFGECTAKHRINPRCTKALATVGRTRTKLARLTIVSAGVWLFAFYLLTFDSTFCFDFWLLTSDLTFHSITPWKSLDTSAVWSVLSESLTGMAAPCSETFNGEAWHLPVGLSTLAAPRQRLLDVTSRSSSTPKTWRQKFNAWSKPPSFDAGAPVKLSYKAIRRL